MKRPTTTLAALLAALLIAPPAAGEAPPDLRQQIALYVADRAPSPDVRVDVPSLAGFAPDPAPAGLRVDLSTSRRESFLGLVPVTVALHRGDELLRRGVVTVEVQALERVAVARRPLRTGHVLGSADLEQLPRDVARLPAGWTREPLELVGQRLTRPVRAGAPVLRSQVEPVPVVRRGQRVRMRLERGSLRIEGMALAREDGRTGDWIRVLNPSSRREVVGRVSADGVIHVGE